MADGEREAVAGGRSVEEAVTVAASRLGLRPEEAEVDVLQEGGRGWLGLGTRDARVRVRRPTKGAAAERLLRRLAEHLGSAVDVEVSPPAGETAIWSIMMATEEAGRWIGYRGQTLEAVRVWCDAAATRIAASRERLVVDVGGYRERREQVLRFMAERAAAEVRRLGREVALDEMTPADRRIVHLALQGLSGVRTESVGEEPHRRVVIVPSQ